MKSRVLQVAAIIVAFTAAGCGTGKPAVAGLRESFAQQLASNRAVRDFQQSGEDFLFSGPGTDGGVVKWRIHIDSAVIEPTGDPRAPYKGTVKSSWYSNDQVVRPSSSGRDSNLPVALTETGLAQDCYALWDPAAKKWGW
jgi:hypothetical protein